MPRILPRLIREIEKQTDQPKFFPFPTPAKRRKSLYKPPLPPPSFHPSHHARSILLTPRNPVTDTKEYVRHKRLPPTLSRPRSLDPDDVDPPRQMSDKEFGWWANPYLRMLTSPMRTCAATNRVLPTDFLIRLIGMRLPPSRLAGSRRSSQSMTTLAPDGILHPKYTSRKAGGGTYVLCWRNAMLQLRNGGYKRIAGKLFLPPHLADYIAHLLRLRVLQEFEVLAERLEHAVRSGRNLGNHGVILRRLTRKEWGSMRSTGTIAYDNSVAVLIVPPSNRDPVTKERPKGSMAALPPEDEQLPKTVPPLSVLMPTSSNPVNDELPDSLPRLEIPLYNSIMAFPSRSQRSALHSLLLRILTAERFLKRLHWKSSSASSSPPLSPKETPKPSKGSHAFLLCSDKGTAKRGDPAGIARALWRLRMFESEGWPSPHSP